MFKIKNVRDKKTTTFSNLNNLKFESMKSIFNLMFTIVVIALLLNSSCKKEDPNQLPVCRITAPVDGQEVNNEDIVTIKVEADDSDGDIATVQFFVDGNLIGMSNTHPFELNWNNISESIGNHTIKVVCVDNNEARVSDEITVSLVEAEKFGSFTDPRDGETYTTVRIGHQRWFAENLNFETPDSWGYHDSIVHGDIYGRLYAWDEALTVCPTGWHLPSDNEWQILEMELGMSETEVAKMVWRGTDEAFELKSTSDWIFGGYGNNNSGFNAFPAGVVGSDNNTYLISEDAFFWCSTEFTSTKAFSRDLHYTTHQISRYPTTPKYQGMSVRCLKD